jgi:hypothetical protein
MICNYLVIVHNLSNIHSGYIIHSGGQGSSVIIVSGYGLGDREIEVRPLCPDQLWSPLSLLSNGYRRSFPGGKARPGRDADHSPSSSAEVKNE